MACVGRVRVTWRAGEANEWGSALRWDVDAVPGTVGGEELCEARLAPERSCGFERTPAACVGSLPQCRGVGCCGHPRFSFDVMAAGVMHTKWDVKET